MLKSNHARAVVTILAVSLLLRWALILQGGQNYFSDEGRYETSRAFVKLAADGNFSEAFSQFFIAPEHLGFKIIGIVPALVEQFTGESLAIPALFFSLFSVANLYLIYKISKRTGVTDHESLVALILAASSMSLLYFSRHLLPYDTALTFGLLAVYVALNKKPNTKTSLACGTLGFACFITYNGYWSLAALGMFIMSLRGGLRRDSVEIPTKQSPATSGIFKTWANNFLQKGSLVATGFILPASLLFVLAFLAGTNLLTEYRSFSSTVNQGSFNEGWSLPFEYFWHAEHWLFIVLIALSIFAVAQAIKQRDNSLILWAGCIALIYACLVIPSVLLHSFVVYGRLARQIMPFLILLSASGLARLEQNFPFGQKLLRAVMLIVVIQAAWNYKASFNLWYPREFAQEAQTLQHDFHFSEKRLTFGAPTLCQNNGYIIENVKRFEIPPEPNPIIQGELFLSAPHPDNFLPYQYEGYTPEQRQIFRELKPEMRFYKVDNEFMSESNPVWTKMKNCLVVEQ